MCCTPVAPSPDICIKQRWIIHCEKHFSSMTPNHTTNFFAVPCFKCSCRHISLFRLNIMTDSYATCCRFPVLKVLPPSNTWNN
jgi:hypothetical protein